mgnify:CR=1 FL=1
MNVTNIFYVVLMVSLTGHANDFTDWLKSKKGRVWTSSDGRKLTARLEGYDWPAKTVSFKLESGKMYTVPMAQLSKSDQDYIKDLATVPKVITDLDIKSEWLAYQKVDDRGNPIGTGGKSGRMIEQFKGRVRAGFYDLEAQIKALEWNVAEYRRVGDMQSAGAANVKMNEVSLLKEQRDLQRQQIAATEAVATANQEIAIELKEINSQLWMLRQGW